MRAWSWKTLFEWREMRGLAGLDCGRGGGQMGLRGVARWGVAAHGFLAEDVFVEEALHAAAEAVAADGGCLVWRGFVNVVFMAWVLGGILYRLTAVVCILIFFEVAIRWPIFRALR